MTVAYIPKKHRNFSAHISQEFLGGHVFHVCKLCGYARTSEEQVKRHTWKMHMQRGTLSSQQAHWKPPDSNDSLDAALLHLVKGLPLPPGVSIPDKILGRFREGQSFFACVHCEYVGDRRTHARSHVLRIHVRGSRAIVRRRKYLEQPAGAAEQSEGANEQGAEDQKVAARLVLPDSAGCYFFGEWNQASSAVRQFMDGASVCHQEHTSPLNNSTEASSSPLEDWFVETDGGSDHWSNGWP